MVNNIIQQSVKKQELNQLPYGREVIGAYGEPAGVTCPRCSSREYPHHKEIEKCATCGALYRVPLGYVPPDSYRNEFLTRLGLKASHRAAGLHLREDDHTITLCHGDNEVANFTIHATMESISAAADDWMNQQSSGVSFEKTAEPLIWAINKIAGEGA